MCEENRSLLLHSTQKLDVYVNCDIYISHDIMIFAKHPWDWSNTFNLTDVEVKELKLSVYIYILNVKTDFDYIPPAPYSRKVVFDLDLLPYKELE